MVSTIASCIWMSWFPDYDGYHNNVVFFHQLRLDEEYRAAFQAYKEKTTEFMEAHPEYRKTPQKTKRKPKRRNPLPHSTKAAFDFYCESKSQLDDTEVSGPVVVC